MVDRNDDGVFVSGVKMQQTGCVNSHWFIVILTMRLSVDDKDFTIVGTIPAHADEIAYTYGRQFSDIRSMGASSIDAGNVEFGGQEAMILLDQVFIPTTVFSWMVNINLHPPWSSASLPITGEVIYVKPVCVNWCNGSNC